MKFPFSRKPERKFESTFGEFWGDDDPPFVPSRSVENDPTLQELARKDSEARKDQERHNQDRERQDRARQDRERQARQDRDRQSRSNPRSHSEPPRHYPSPKVDSLTHHQILGVRPDATRQQIKDAYKRLALIYHPDKGGSNEMFKLINKAYRTLCPD
jgi:hypothetical protein